MSNRKMGPLIAVGLVFSTGGHQLTLDRNGAQAATSTAQFTPFQTETNVGYQSCEIEPSSGCMQLLPNMVHPTPHLPPSMQGFCHATGEPDGASGSVCLFMGS